MKLGKLPARPGAVKIAFADVFNQSHLATPPTVFGVYNMRMPWQTLANDLYGCCVWSGAAHETMIWSSIGGARAVFNDQCVLGDYSTVTGFNPANLDTDVGTDLQKAAAYRQKVGILDIEGKRHKIDAYVSLHAGDLQQIATAAYILGVVGIGLQLPDYAYEQFDKREPWAYTSDGKPAGGHYVPLVGRTTSGNFLVITWGRLQEVTPEFLVNFMDEGIAYLSYERLNNFLDPLGFEETRLRKALSQIAKMKEQIV